MQDTNKKKSPERYEKEAYIETYRVCEHFGVETGTDWLGPRAEKAARDLTIVMTFHGSFLLFSFSLSIALCVCSNLKKKGGCLDGQCCR